MNMNTIIQKERNSAARIEVDSISKEYGVRLGFIAKQLDMEISSFSHWKNKKYEFGKNKLNKIEMLISKYNSN